MRHVTEGYTIKQAQHLSSFLKHYKCMLKVAVGHVLLALFNVFDHTEDCHLTLRFDWSIIG